jgi:hypothetical protein
VQFFVLLGCLDLVGLVYLVFLGYWWCSGAVVESRFGILEIAGSIPGVERISGEFVQPKVGCPGVIVACKRFLGLET